MLRRPPDVLITTPESLFLLLTSPNAREVLRTVTAVIVDEVHAVAATKRGSHLALSLERLDVTAGREVQRIALSATQRPLDEIARFVGGDRDVTIVDAGSQKVLDLEVLVPVDDMTALPDATSQGEVSGDPSANTTIWPAIYPELLRLVEEHTTTLVFVNYRRLSERLALRLNELAGREVARAHHGSLAREARTQVEEALKRGELKCLVATSLARARHRHGRDRPRRADRVARLGRARPAADRPGRPPGRRAVDGPHLPEVPRRPGGVRRRHAPHARGRDRGDARAAQRARRAVAADRGGVRDRRVAGRRPVRARPARLPVPRAAAGPVRRRARHAVGPLPVRRLRRAAAAHRLGPDRRQRHGPVERPPAGRRERRHDPRPRPVRRVPGRRLGPRRRAGRGDGLRGARRPGVRARRVVVAHRADHPRPRARLPRARARPARSRSGRARRRAARSSSAGRSACSCARPAR